jgi:hypothetical protein
MIKQIDPRLTMNLQNVLNARQNRRAGTSIDFLPACTYIPLSIRDLLLENQTKSHDKN